MSFGIPELLLVLVIVVLLFGTTKLKSLGNDLGSAIKGFRSALDTDDDKSKLIADEERPLQDTTSEAPQTVESKKKS